MKKSNKTFKRSVALVLCFAILAAIGIGAYLTDSDVKSDVYTVGNVQAEIVSNGDMELDNVGALLPGTVHVYERAATNTGINDAYVFMSLTIPYEMVGVSDTDGTQIGERVRQLFIPGVPGGYIGSEWKLVDVGYIGQYEIEDNGQYCGEHDQYSAVVGDTITYVYGFIGDNADGSLKALASGETTSNLVETMQLTNLYNASKITGEVSTKLYAIQSNHVNGGLTDVNGVWAVINNAISGEATEASTVTYNITNTKNGEAVGYAPLKLVDENGNIVATSVATENGAGQFKNVPAGVYTLETEVGNLSLDGTRSKTYARSGPAVILSGEDQYLNIGLTTPQNTLVQGAIFNTYIPSSVTSVEFVAMPQTYSLADRTVPADAIDVSEEADGSVMAWVEGDVFYVVAMDGGMIYANPNSNYMFYNKSNLTYIGVDNLSFSGIYSGSFIFSNCGSLTNSANDFDLSNMRNINNAFEYCPWLTEYTIPEGTLYIPYGTFQWCTGLASIEIPSSVKTIEGSAFNGCTSLTSVVIPEGVEKINSFAFANCNNLTSVSISSTVNYIAAADDQYGAFYGCDNLTAINVDPANEYFVSVDDVLFTKDMKTLIKYAAKKTDTEYTIPSGVEVIATNAFASSFNLNTVIIPDGVTVIDNDAFSACINLTIIEIPSSVETIGIQAFSNTQWLQDKIANEGVVIVNGIWIDASAASGEFVIPEGTTSIPNNAFYQSNITSVYIPASVTAIGEKAFYWCTDLETVIFAEGSQLKSIGYMAFAECTNLTSIYLPNSVETIETGAFLNCQSLTNINVPASVTDLYSVFVGTGITSLTIPNNVLNVYPLYNCPNLTEIVVADDHPTLMVVDGVLYTKDMSTLICYPAGKTDISYVVPKSVTYIGSNAFYGNKYLQEVTLFKTVSAISFSCFEDCNNLKAINFCGTQAQFNQINLDLNWNTGVHSEFKITFDCVYPDIPNDNGSEPTLRDGQIAVYIVDNTSNTANIEKPLTYHIFVGGKAHKAQLAYGDEYAILSDVADGTYTVSISVEYPTLGVQSPNQNIEEVIIDADNRVITVILSD